MANVQGRVGEQIGENRLERYPGRGSFGAVYLAKTISAIILKRLSSCS